LCANARTWSIWKGPRALKAFQSSGRVTPEANCDMAGTSALPRRRKMEHRSTPHTWAVFRARIWSSVLKLRVELMAAAISISPETRASALAELGSGSVVVAEMSAVAESALALLWRSNIPGSFWGMAAGGTSPEWIACAANMGAGRSGNNEDNTRTGRGETPD